jgi:sec-independent protein translocase protein TatA
MIGNIGPVQLLIILLIVLLIFGTKRIRSLGSDLGGAIKEFRKGMGDDSTQDKKNEDAAPTSDQSKASDASDSLSKTARGAWQSLKTEFQTELDLDHNRKVMRQSKSSTPPTTAKDDDPPKSE